MAQFPVIISFYTSKTPYQEEVKNLIASCEKYQIEHAIESIDSFGSWELNCSYKPFFILKKWNELKRPLLWIDADGVLVKKPVWQSAFEADVAVRINEDLPTNHPSRVISSTIFINHTPKAYELIKLWAKECQKELLNEKRQNEFWDQISLNEAILKNPMGAKVAAMPLSYAKIFDHPQDCLRVQEPVIEHYQASRRFKQLV